MAAPSSCPQTGADRSGRVHDPASTPSGEPTLRWDPVRQLPQSASQRPSKAGLQLPTVVPGLVTHCWCFWCFPHLANKLQAQVSMSLSGELNLRKYLIPRGREETYLQSTEGSCLSFFLNLLATNKLQSLGFITELATHNLEIFIQH